MHSLLVGLAAGRTPLSRLPRRLFALTASALLGFVLSSGTARAQTQLGVLNVTEPTGIAIDTDASGTRWMYVSQHGDTNASPPTNGGIVWKYNLTTGAAPVAITSYGTGDGQFISPDGIVIEPTTHDLYVTDRYSSRVQRLHADGTFVMKWGTQTIGAPDEMHGPCGIGLDGTGAVYISEHGDATTQPYGTGGQHVSKYTVANSGSTWTATRVWRVGSFGAGDGQFRSTGPYGLALHGNTIYVADAFANRVETFDLNGNYISQFSTGSVAQPLGLYIDPANNLWIAETSNSAPNTFDGGGPLQQVQKFDLSGNYAGVTLTGSNPAFHLPFDTVVDSVAGKAYVTDYADSRVVIFDLSPPVTGNGPSVTSFGYVDGTRYVQIQFSEPVTGVTTNSFVFTTTGNSNASFDSVTQIDSSTYRLNFTFNFGAPGSLVFDIETSGSGITGVNSGLAYSGAGITKAVVPVTPHAETDAPVVGAFGVGNANGATVPFYLFFNKGTWNLQPSNFTINTTGSASGTLGLIQPTDDTGTVYTVPVTYSGSGTISLTVSNATQQTIEDGNHNKYVGPDTSQVFTIPAAASSAPVVQNWTINGLATGTWMNPVAIPTTNAPMSFSAPGLRQYGLAIDSSGVITGNPIAPASNATVSITAANAFGVSAPATLTLNITGTATGGAPVLSNVTVMGRANTAISPVTVPATNSPTSFSAPGLSTYGLAIDPSSGVITGTPPAAVSTTVSVTAQNASGTSNAATITLNISAATTPPPAPTITSATTASATANSAFSYQITATGNPTSYAADNLTGTGLSLNATSGLISGTPSASGTITSHLTATNSGGTSAPVTLTITVSAAAQPPTITSATTATATAGATFSYQITASGSPTSYAADNLTGTGLSLNATSGLISGTPSASGTITTHLTATNSGGTSAPVTLTITVSAATQPPTITSATTATATAGAAFSYQITASGSPTSYAADNLTGTGLSLTTTSGLISGTPSAAGSITTHLTATNAAGTSAPVTLTITVNAAPGTSTIPEIMSFVLDTQHVSASSAQFLVTFNEPVTGVDATDFAVNTQGTATATITGVTPVSTSEYAVTFNYTGTNGSVQMAIKTSGTGIVDSAGHAFTGVGFAASDPVVVNNTPPADATVPTVVSFDHDNPTSSAVNYTITFSEPVTGVVPSAFIIFHDPGLTVANGAMTHNASGTTYTLPLTFSGSGSVSLVAVGGATTNIRDAATNWFEGATSTVLTIGPSGTAPSITSGTTATATAGAAFSYQITATGSPTAYAADNLTNTGLSINPTSGLISGTLNNSSGTIVTHLTASNSFGTSAPVTLTITVNAAPPPPANPPVVSNASVTGTVGTPITPVQVSATNNPTSFSAIGLTVYGLSINPASGLITGTPGSTATNANVSVTASNSAGTSNTATITLNIAAASTGGNSGGGNPGGGNPGGGGGTPPPTQNSQTITFVAPTSNIFVGDSVVLTGTASSGLPVSYSIVSGDATLFGNVLTINNTTPVVVQASQSGNASWAAASTNATFVAIKKAQVLVTTPIPPAAHTDHALTLAATSSSGLPLTYSVISGPATVSGNTLTFTGTGTIVLGVSQPGNNLFSPATTTMTITANPIPRLVNISSRLAVSANDSNGASIAGFVVTGTAPKQMLIRAVGPALTAFGINSPLADPTLKLYNSQGTVIASNTGWNNDAPIAAAADAVGAFKLAAGSKDSAILVSLPPGAYTAQVESTDASGTVLIEVYDVTANAAVPTKQLINISTRGYVGTGDNVLVGGFVVSGTESKQVLIRGIGPTLASFGVAGTLADPVLKIYDAHGAVIAQNDNWGTPLAATPTDSPATAAEITSAESTSGAFPLTSGSTDAAVVVTLPPGAYTAIVSGANGSTGNAMVEIYEVP